MINVPTATNVIEDFIEAERIEEDQEQCSKEIKYYLFEQLFCPNSS